MFFEKKHKSKSQKRKEPEKPQRSAVYKTKNPGTVLSSPVHTVFMLTKHITNKWTLSLPSIDRLLEPFREGPIRKVSEESTLATPLYTFRQKSLQALAQIVKPPWFPADYKPSTNSGGFRSQHTV